MSNSLRPHESQHARPPCPSPTPGFTHTHIHRVSDAVQQFHPLSSPSLPTFNLAQHQGLFQWVSFSHQVAKELEFQLQHQSFQWIFRLWSRKEKNENLAELCILLSYVAMKNRKTLVVKGSIPQITGRLTIRHTFPWGITEISNCGTSCLIQSD